MKNKEKLRDLILLITLIFVFSTVLTGCTTYKNFKDYFIEANVNINETVRIGVFEPLTGEHSEQGKLEIQGIELAHELYPRVLGKEVELIYADNKSDTEVAAVAAKELVDRQVSVVLGSWSSTLSLIGGEYFAEAKIPSISITATNPLVTSCSEYSFRTCFVESFQGVALAKYAVEDMGFKRAAIIKDADDDYAAAVSTTFSDKFIALTENKNSIVRVVDITSGEKDFKDQLSGIKSLNAEVIFLSCKIADTAEIMKQAKEIGIEAVFMGTSEWESEKLITIGGEAVDGAVFSTFFDSDSNLTEKTDVFLKAYREKYGKDSNPQSSEALGFDAYLLAINAIKSAGTSEDGLKIRVHLAKTKDFLGAAGSITFDMNGNPIRSVVIKTIKDGEFIYTDTVEPSWQ